MHTYVYATCTVCIDVVTMMLTGHTYVTLYIPQQHILKCPAGKMQKLIVSERYLSTNECFYVDLCCEMLPSLSKHIYIKVQSRKVCNS